MDQTSRISARPVRMTVLAYEDVRPFQLSIPSEVFDDIYSAGVAARIRICGVTPGPLRTRSGFLIEPDCGLDELHEADVVFVPSWRLPYAPPSSALTQALLKAHENGATVVGLCLGAFVLAEAGLLDGKRATTHWAFAGEFRERFPKVLLDEASLYVDEGEVLTSAGASAGVDCCLHLARRLFGPAVANEVARNVLAGPYRAGGQTQFIERPLAESARDARFRAALDAVAESLGGAHSVASTAQAAGLSRRSFTRHFQKIMGLSFGDWLTNERLAKAQRDLETSALGVDEIALGAGFGSPVTFRAQFRKRLGVSPTQWRKALRGGAT